MKNINANKTHKFLLLALLMTISFNQVAFCMQRDAEARDKSLGDLSIIPNEILFNIFSFANMKAKKNLLCLNKSKILKEVFFSSPENHKFTEILKEIEKIKNDKKTTGPRLIILHGESQSGKTHSAEVLAKNAFGANKFTLECGTRLSSRYATENKLKALFNKIKNQNEKISIIIIDEFDSIMPHKRIANYLQEALDKPKYKNFILILTTNHIDYIPMGIKDRSSMTLEINRQLSADIIDWYSKDEEDCQQKSRPFSILKSIFCCSSSNRE